jgi:hypothetical protein
MKTSRLFKLALCIGVLNFLVCGLAQAQGTTPVNFTVTFEPDPLIAGSQATFTASVTSQVPGAGTPTGTVNIGTTDSSGPSCTITLPATTCSLTLPQSSAGTDVIFIYFYSGDANFQSAGFTKTNPVVTGTTTALTSSPNPSQLNAAVLFTATVTSSAATGTVAFNDGSTTICGAAPLSAGVATCSTSTLAGGGHSITATYSGNANYGTSTSPILIQSVHVTTSGTTLTSSLNPSNAGDAVTFTASVNGNAPTGTVTFIDNAGVLCNAVSLSAGVAKCSVAFQANGTHPIQASYSGDANNVGSTASILNQLVGASPFVNLDQFGLTGTWYNPATSGQGFFLDFFPELNAPGTGFVAGSWFTYDVTPAGGAEKQRWYTFSGNVAAFASTAQLTIYSSVGGNFNAAPKVPALPVGQATLQFTSCGSGSLYYNFTDGSGRSNTIPLTRLTPNVTCGASSDNGNPVGSFLLSGAWYDPNTSGQGLLFEVNPILNYFAAAWYTYIPGGQTIGGVASQRWYTLQAPLTGSATINDIPIYASVGGIFNNPVKPTLSQVGTAQLIFQSCSTATLTFNFTGGSSNGQNGSISLQRIGSTPTGCGL